MTRYLLDTNIVSNLIKPAPSPALLRWLGEQVDTNLHIASWTLGEVRRGILQLPAGRKRDSLDTWFWGPDGPPAQFDGRILPYDERAAEVWAELVADGYRSGRPRSEPDMIVAAVAVANDCTVVTDNERHFNGIVPLLNPVR